MGFHKPCGGVFLQGATRAIAVADIVCMIFAMIVNITGTVNAFRRLREKKLVNGTTAVIMGGTNSSILIGQGHQDSDNARRISNWLWTLTSLYFVVYITYVIIAVILFIAARKRSLRKCRLYVWVTALLFALAVGFFIIHMVELDADPYVIVMCLCFHAYKFYSVWVVYSFMREIQSMGDYNGLMRDLTDDEIRDFEIGNPNSMFIQTGISHYEKDAFSKPFDTAYEIPWNRMNVDYKTVLGTGAFGMVLKGKLTKENGDKVDVAVKTTKTDANVLYFNSLLMEIKMMAFLGPHENLVNLIGCITQDIRERRVWIVVELCSNGNLEGYIKRHKNNFRNLIKNNQIIPLDSAQRAGEHDPSDNIRVGSLDGDDGDGCVESEYDLKSFSTEDLIFWAYEIAKGMEYLERKKVVHGDLAVRNVLLTSDHSVKITDFGLSRKLCNYEPYVKKDSTPLPWRYMSIESLKHMSFSTKTDVWSYGITLWELFTLGNVPYSGMSWTLNFVDQLQDGLRLNKPQYSTYEIYEIMQSCWNGDPDGRPKFSELKDNMKEILADINPLAYGPRDNINFSFYNT